MLVHSVQKLRRILWYRRCIAQGTKKQHSNAKQRTGILGVFGLCIGNLREWGLPTAATVVLRGMDLHSEDEELVKKITDPGLTLKHMPRHLTVESDILLESQLDGLPKKDFPKKRGTIYWYLFNDPGEQYKIK